MVDKNVVTSIEQLRQMYNLEDIESNKQSIANVTGVIQSTNAELADFVTQVTEDIADLQSQVDGTITSWFYEGEPTLLNLPASGWLESEYESHKGDLYYDQLTGYAYRFSYIDAEYSWVRLSDTDATLALSIANAAQDTADSKRRTFITTPTPPYDIGDIWFGNDTNDLKRAQTARTAEESYNAADWIKAVKYTDDSTFNVVIDKINTSPEATKIATTKLSADVITTTNLSAQNISAGQITTGTLSTSRLASDVITTSNFSAQNINADKITSGTLTSVALDAGNGALRISSGGTLRYYDGGGWLYCGGNSRVHPYVSALNIARSVNQGETGISFRDSIDRTDAGSALGHISMISGGYMEIYADANINIRAAANMALDVGTGNYIRVGAAGDEVRLSSYTLNGHVFTGADGGTMYVNSNVLLNPISGFYAYVNSTSSSSNRIAVSSAGPSSRNVKSNIKDLKDYTSIYSDLQKLKLHTFDYKYKGIKDFDKDFGFIIDEIEDLPELSKYARHYEVEGYLKDNSLLPKRDGDEEQKSLDKLNYKEWDRDSYIKMQLVLIKTLQEKIDTLEKRIDKLERGE